MKKQKWLAIFLIVLCVGVSAASILKLNKGMEVTHGLYGVTIEMNAGEEAWEYDADDVVPDKETLISNLEDKGYEIEEYSAEPGSDIAVQRIVAIKGNHYIDFCYGLTQEEAEIVFAEYENRYLNLDFYVLARNQEYIYCISSEKAYKHCGFTELSNDGVMYLCE